jgi:hypothetical protein
MLGVMKKLFGNAFKKQTMFEVIGGTNYLPKSSGNVYLMISEEKEHGEGVVSINKKLYYFLGAHKEQSYSRSAGKAAAGAIIGGALTGGVGAVIGAAIGGRKKDTSLFWIDFADYETKQEFSVQVKPKPKFSPNSISDFRPANPKEIGLDE